MENTDLDKKWEERLVALEEISENKQAAAACVGFILGLFMEWLITK